MEKGNHHPDRRHIGSRYENMAAEYLKRQGVTILEQNYHGRQGEIDLIGKDGDYLVFIEVKYRRTVSHGAPAEAVTSCKQRRIRMTAQYYLYSRRYGSVPCRFDVVCILGGEIQWIRNAF